MTLSRINPQNELDPHPLQFYVDRANAHLRNKKEDKFNALINTLHEIAGKANETAAYSIKKNTPIYSAINQLFKDSKEKYTNQERLDEIRMKQATFLEHTGDIAKALRITQSLAQKASAPLRWAAANSRTWLLRTMGFIMPALDSSNEVIEAYAALPKHNNAKLSRTRLAAARKLAQGTREILNRHIEEAKKIQLSSSPFTQYGKVQEVTHTESSTVTHKRKLKH